MTSLLAERAKLAPREEPDEAGERTPLQRIATPTLMPWLDLRHRLGKSRDRRKWLQFLCSTTSYDPLPWQIRFHLAGRTPTDVRPNKLAVCGIGAGKTTGSVAESSALHIVNPGCDHIMIAPTYDQCREILLPQWLARAEELEENGYPLIRKANWSILRFDLHCGGRVFFRSAEKVSNLRGFQFATLGGDEWDFMRSPMDVWDTLSGRLRDQRAYQRQAIITTTPYTYTNSIIEHFALQRVAANAIEDPVARAVAQQQWWFCRAPTSANPHLPQDYLEGLTSYSKAQYIREVLAYPTVHRAARVYECYDPETHLTDVGYDKSKPYDIACDWGFHKPAFVFVQEHQGKAIVFAEWMPDDIDANRQIAGLADLFKALGKDPEHAVVDRADTTQIAAFRRRFRQTTIISATSKAEQSRLSTIDALTALLDPYQGSPRLFVARRLADRTASDRGVHQSLTNLEWEYDRANNRYLDDAKKDGKYEHAAEALGYWAKLRGLDRAKAYQIRPIVYGARGHDDLLARLKLS